MKQIEITNEQESGANEIGRLRTSGKKTYETMSMTVVMTASASPILAGSVVNKSVITAVGQELGPSYDLNSSGGIDSNTGKTFSLEWETGELL